MILYNGIRSVYGEIMNRDLLKKQIREWTKLGYIVPEDIPSIELYMDQVTTFMDRYLSPNKRTDEDKTLTKTMINNYTKNELLPPPDKKRYSKDHIIILIYIYYLKNMLSISDIQTMLKPLIDKYYDNAEAEYSLEDIYSSMFELEKHQTFNIESSIVRTYELSEKNFPESDDSYLRNLTVLSLLGYDIFVKKKLMEHIIDDMAKEAEALTKAEEEKAARAVKREDKEIRKDSRKDTRKK